jgi:cation diffusion facilitator family transporter
MASSMHSQPKETQVESNLGRRVTLVGAAANAVLIAIKFIAGVFGQSQALIADAVHSLSDFFTDAIVLVGLWAGRKGPDREHHFGHARIETISSGLVGVSLIGVAVYLGYDSGSNIYDHTEKHPTWLAFGGAVVSIAVKEWLYRYTAKAGRRIKSTVVMANAWHHRSDALSSVAVMLGVLAAQLNPDWHMLDAYAALLVSFMIGVVGLKVLWSAVLEVIDTAPDPVVIDRMIGCIKSIGGVFDHHDLKVRSSGGMLLMQVHLVVDGQLSVEEGHRIAKDVEGCLLSSIENLSEVIVHIDPGHRG